MPGAATSAGEVASGLRRLRDLRGLPLLREQLRAAAIGMAGDPLEDVMKVRPGVEPVSLACRHEAVENRGALAAGIGATEEPGFPAGDDFSERAFASVVVDREVAVLAVLRERRHCARAWPTASPIGSLVG